MGASLAGLIFVFPACAGVILDTAEALEMEIGVPRVCGGDPRLPLPKN